MFYRRKILLALLEAFGGSLAKTDCQKLLFLLCLRSKKNYYDFFPHKYGNFSLILSQDRNRLADLGFLESRSDYQLKGSQSYGSQLEKAGRTALHALVEEIGDLRGQNLIRKVYLEAPHYTSRSQIVDQVLSAAEYERVRHVWNRDTSPCFFTIGYEGLSIDAYLDILLANNVAVLVDVRKNPISMKYGFSKSKLAEYAQFAGIAYVHMPDLGIPSAMRSNLDSPEAYRTLFGIYASQILPGQQAALEQLKALAHNRSRVAITCFEADHQFCHRHKVAEYLANDADFTIPIVHLSKKCLSTAIQTNNPLTSGLWEEHRLYSSI